MDISFIPNVYYSCRDVRSWVRRAHEDFKRSTFFQLPYLKEAKARLNECDFAVVFAVELWWLAPPLPSEEEPACLDGKHANRSQRRPENLILLTATML